MGKTPFRIQGKRYTAYNYLKKIKEKITETAVLTYLHTKSDAKSSYVTVSLNFLNENGDVVHVYNIVSPKNEIKVYE